MVCVNTHTGVSAAVVDLWNLSSLSDVAHTEVIFLRAIVLQYHHGYRS